MFSEIRQDFSSYSSAYKGRLGQLAGPFLQMGFYVSFSYRLRHFLHKCGSLGRAVSTIMGLWTQVITGCYISPKANIGGGLSLPHPVAVVVGDGVTIGTGVRIFQSVTIGSKSRGANSYPIIGDRVVIYPNSVLIGGINVGHDSVIGAGSVVTRSVASAGLVAGNPARAISSGAKDELRDISQ